MTSGNATSLTLLQRLRKQENSAWERFAYLYRPLIAWWCRKWSLAEADVDDVTQEVVTAVFTHLPSYVATPGAGGFRAWLRGITRHKLLEFNRRRDRGPEVAGGSVALAMMQEVADSEFVDSPDELAGLYLRAAEAVRADFSQQTWDIFWRTAVEAQAPVDVATELGLNPAAVRMAKARVLRRIREEIGETDD